MSRRGTVSGGVRIGVSGASAVWQNGQASARAMTIVAQLGQRT
jgi:hypothetical protein